ncbi:MAG: hypothetical protein IH988_02800 [Planctomycetes bacterium]|nr:hypothetical protein [Planctomycetota bacterium]
MTETETDSSTGAPCESTGGSIEAPRRCLACGYDLRGQGEDLRCPECGLRNIPSAYRQQVWDLVDSGRWFFSGFFSPFRKRLPGWWWALDRSGDVLRSFRFAARHALISFVLVVGLGLAVDSVLVEITTVSILNYPTGRSAPGFLAYESVTGVGAFGRPHYSTNRDVSDRYGKNPPTRQPAPSTRAVFVGLSASSLYFPLYLWSWGLLIWGVPTAVGLCTQIRKGLPPFARAPRTILAAGNYEAHRMTYFAAVWVLVLTLEFLLSWSFQFIGVVPHGMLSFSGMLVAALFGMLGWAGPLRSDYTAQLIRSRAHAVRISLMYALALPAVSAFALVAGLELLISRWY